MSIWPCPQSLKSGDHTVWLSPNVELLVQDNADLDQQACWYQDLDRGLRYKSASVSHHPQTPDDLVQCAFERMKSKIFERNVVSDIIRPQRSAVEPTVENSTPCIQTIILTEDSNVPDDLSAEAYAINIRTNGTVQIHTASPVAALWAFESLFQLFHVHANSPDRVNTQAPLEIQDAPIFEHRGLLIDISRNWISPKDIIRTIDGLSMNKMNRLHLHATDSQSWPLEIPSLPDLARKGAYSEDQIWTADDLDYVQKYGMYRGVEVFLEVDIPGHTASIAHAFPNLIAAYNQQPWDKWAMEPPSGQLRLDDPAVYQFLDTLLNDLLPRTKPYTTRFHLGGDELNTEVHTLDPTVQSSSREILQPLLQKLFNHVTDQLKKLDIVPHMWQDMLLEWDLDLHKHIIIQAWKPGALQSILEKGHRAIFSSYDQWYLDGGFGTFIDPKDPPAKSSIRRPYLDWNSPYKNWRQILSYDPLAEVPSEQHHLVIGGEMCLWGELTDSVSLDFMLWPRVAAGAEVLWKGKGDVCEATTRRLAGMRERLVEGGIQAGVVQMEWALRNPGSCVL